MSLQKVKYDRIGVGYNRHRCADPEILDGMGRRLGNPEGPILDVGCGTGNYTVAFAERGMDITGVDPSLHMLARARERRPDLQWFSGTSESLPVGDQCFAGAVAMLTLHHWSSLERGFREIGRVLQPAARLVMFTSTPEQMRHYWLSDYFPQMMEASIVQMPSLEKVRGALVKAGFKSMEAEPYFVSDELKDGFLYSAKTRPRRYLDPSFRAGISSFADLALQDEVRKGLKRLELDIDSGRLEDRIRHAQNDIGDYLFVTATSLR